MTTEIQRLEQKIDDLSAVVQDLAVKLAAFIAGAGADKVAIEARLAKLEASPMRAIAWVSAGAGCLSTIGTLLSLLLAVVIWVMTYK